MSLYAKTGQLRSHITGGFMCHYHYRTSDSLEDIKGAGDDYWATLASVVNVGDVVLVQAQSLAWSYVITITGKERIGGVWYVSTRLGSPWDGEYYDQDQKSVDDAARKAEKEAEEKRLAEIQRRRDALETNEVQPDIKWAGPSHRFRIEAYEQIIQSGYEEREDAEAAMSTDAIRDLISSAREAYMINNGVNG